MWFGTVEYGAWRYDGKSLARHPERLERGVQKAKPGTPKYNAPPGDLFNRWRELNSAKATAPRLSLLDEAAVA